MTSQFIEFISPNQIDSQLQTIASQHHLKELLKVKMEQNDYEGCKINFKIITKKQKYLYANCYHKACRACLRYKINKSGTFSLTKANLKHHHIVKNAKSIKFKGVSDFIKSVPDGVQKSSLKKITCSQFGINQKQFYYIMNKAKSPSIQFHQLISKLEHQQYQIMFSTQDHFEEQMPDIFFAASESMISNFQKYGDTVTFDLTFNMIKNIHISGRKWKVGAFLGMSAAKHIVPFGLVITLFQSKQTYVRIFRTFFKAMKGQPKVIITDEQKSLQAAIKQLISQKQYHGIHLLDAYHILKNVRKNLKVRQHLIFFKNLIHARNDYQFRKYLKQAEDNLHKDQKQHLMKFIKSSQLYCFSKITPVFFGFTSCTSNQRFHNLIKMIQPSQKEYCITVSNILYYMKRLQTKFEEFILQTLPYESILMIPELKVIRVILSKPIFTIFIEEIIKSMNCEIVEKNSSEAYIKEGGIFFQLQSNQSKLKCTCLFTIKSALPCRHLLRFLLVKKKSILEYIQSRWRIKQAYDLSKGKAKRKIPLGRQRLSRRNRGKKY